MKLCILYHTVCTRSRAGTQCATAAKWPYTLNARGVCKEPCNSFIYPLDIAMLNYEDMVKCRPELRRLPK